MNEAMEFTKTAEALQAAYKNSKGVTDAILSLMPKVKDENLKSDLTVAVSTLEAFCSRIVKGLAEEGAAPKEENAISRFFAQWENKMGAMRDPSVGHLATLLSEGATAAANDLYEQIRHAETAGVSKNTLRILRDTAAFEEKLAEDLKAYIR